VQRLLERKIGILKFLFNEIREIYSLNGFQLIVKIRALRKTLTRLIKSKQLEITPLYFPITVLTNHQFIAVRDLFFDLMSLPFTIQNHEYLSEVKKLIWLLFRNREFEDEKISVDANWLDKPN
jgi:hypothetical protein